ncbi:SusC/RagA family TonB-linked outer membrane protein [Chitinophaga rhizosphaerae]|uniref:SusC/RagA family TonB-linked outer membrane protein n=1 Tax=Chitinophaga rhizosphaerae TaxID=1864947 RepID=UPI0013DF1B54|nr:SusC/RagA family TonB-linked outer membrane protein [Chitinophaga rhizosphaerae]
MGKIAAILVHTLLVTMFLSVGSPSRAQQEPPPPPQDVPKALTFTLSGTFTVGEIFDQLHRQTNIYINRNHSIIDFTRKLTVHFRSTPIREVMDKVLGDLPIDWMITGLDIVLFPSANPVRLKEETITVTGLVMDNDGVVLPGVTIMVKGEPKGGVTNGEGRFRIEKVLPKSTLVINSIGFLSRQYRLDGERKVTFILEPAVSQIEPVEVTANTGYQVLKKKETPGTYTVIDSLLINRPVSPNILDRLEGLGSGMLTFRTPGMINWFPKMPDGADVGFYIRGFNTISPNRVNPNPLIILDNFPYEGNLTNINPNDIASITILKDAAATSIWGARSANGVIVLTTKRGKYVEKMKIDFNMSMTLGLKPNLNDDIHFIESKDYVEMERSLFTKGFYDQDINNTFNRPALSPVVSLMQKNKNGDISLRELDTQLNELKKNDVRRDFSKYSYRNSLGEQYSIGIRGGTKDFTYYLSLGHDRNRTKLVNNYQNRTSIIYNNFIKPTKNLEINAYINYTQNNLQNGNVVMFRSLQSRNGKFTELYPYASFSNNQNEKVPIVKDFNVEYTDSLQKLGFLDWNYYPLDEIGNKSNKITLQNLILRASITYNFLKRFKANLSYQNQRQIISSNYYFDAESYFVRDLVNTFSTFNPITKKVTQQLPNGGIMILGDFDWRANNLRTSLEFAHKIRRHAFRLLVGSELRELKADGSERAQAGYNDINGIPVTNINPNVSYPITPNGLSKFNNYLDFDGFASSLLNRYISYYSVADYNLDQKIEINLVARRDGANLFGARTNHKFSPFWSVGGGWAIDKEEFWNVETVNRLKVRASIGTGGNVYHGAAYLTVRKNPDLDPLTGLPTSVISNPPNEDLRWERTKMKNVGIEIALFNNHIEASFDLFSKRSTDLVQRFDLAPQTGFTNAQLNSAQSKTRGGEVSIEGNWKPSKTTRWRPRFNLSWFSDKLLEYDQQPIRQTIILLDARNNMLRVEGKSSKGMYSYKWAGLDPKTGDPQGYLDGQVSKNYSGILNNFHTDSLVYHGSGVPLIFGTFMNDVSYKHWTLSFTLAYKFKYYFRRPGMPTSYVNLLKVPHEDYVKRWKQPGDERFTSVPSLSFSIDDLRYQFYQKSEVWVEKADNIRLQDIRVSYVVSKMGNSKSIFKHVEFYSYLNNIGILWRANKLGLDPDVQYSAVLESYPLKLSVSIGTMLKF